MKSSNMTAEVIKISGPRGPDNALLVKLGESLKGRLIQKLKQEGGCGSDYICLSIS